MKVTSPVGEFPFDVDRVRFEGRQLTVEGRMGAWPARVEMRPTDGLEMARLFLSKTTVLVLALVVVAPLASRKRRRLNR